MDLAAGQSQRLSHSGVNNQGALLLAGGGHSHALLLRRWAMHPHQRPKRPVMLVNRESTALYSGMVPGLVAGLYRRDEVEINLRHLCDRAGVAFILSLIHI